MATYGKKFFRILMLHGYRQNEKYFYDKTGSVRKALKNYAELIYCQAPHNVPSLESNDLNDTEEFGWWLKSKEWPNSNFETNFKETLDYVNQVFIDKGPFDGVFGFSMGGILTSILCRMIQNQGNYEAINFKFAIICAANVSIEESLASYYILNDPIRIDTLHIIGKSDKLVPLESALELTKYFFEPKIFQHDGGHLIPRDSEAKKAYFDFFEEILKKYDLN